MKKLFLLLVFGCVFLSNTFSQNITASILQDSIYLQNPKLYLSKLDSTKIQSGILIDRVHFTDKLLKVNGSSIVSVINPSEWRKMYNSLSEAAYDTADLIRPADLDKIITSNYSGKKLYSIGIMDVFFNQIKQSALDNGELVKSDKYLIDKSASSSSFSRNRVVAMSCMDHNVYGDKVNFIVNDLMYISNNAHQQIKLVEIDFGNGLGYQSIQFNKPVSVPYNSTSGYIEIKARLTLEDDFSKVTEVLYAHNTIFRTGTQTVPVPSLTVYSKTEGEAPLLNTFYYPEGIHHSDTQYVYVNSSRRVCTLGYKNPICLGCCAWDYEKRRLPNPHIFEWWEGRDIEYNILFAPGNTSGKLRRPFLIVDGFDPGDKRDFYNTRYLTEDLLDRERDFRGIFQTLNGDPSPWYRHESSGNFVADLQNDGYDIIVVNFLDGAGDILKNAHALRGFLKNVINGSTFRDNKTEEIVMVGPSMGGVITRYALTYMETVKENHFVKLWLAFDSPQKGAYIPISLQHSIDFLSRLNLLGRANTAKAPLAILNSHAAQQMLLCHYTKTTDRSNPSILFYNLYNEVERLGHPKYSKNIALSNGGLSKLYSKTGATIVDFKLFNWTYVKGYCNENGEGPSVIGDGPITIFYGERSGDNDENIKTGHQVGYDNGPGGWHPALYSLNCHPENKTRKSESDVPFTRANFIPTASAFGIAINRQNVYTNWTMYTDWNDRSSGKIRTPFDRVHGMMDNEEHLRISNYTKNYLLNDVLRPELENSKHPKIRDSEVINQIVDGKVAYVAKQSLEFAGNNNTFLVSNNSDINMVSGKSITFLPGFEIKANVQLSARLQNLEYNKTLRKSRVEYHPADYGDKSPFQQNSYYYVNNEIYKTETKIEVSASPNPVQNFLNINIEGLQKDVSTRIAISNVYGVEVYSSLVTTDLPSVDMSDFANGMYFLKVTNGSQTSILKIMKTQ